MAALFTAGPVAAAPRIDVDQPSALTAEPAAVMPELAAELQAIIDHHQAARPLPGLAAAVTLADGSRWESGAGLADLGPGNQPFAAGTPTVVGSITKTFVAALVLQLVEEGRLKLKNRLSRWFPEYPFARSIRVRHLLKHTSGLRDYFTHPKYSNFVFGRPTHHWTPEEILTLVRDRLLFSPGSGWSYSNTNYVFLGLIIERVTGQSVASELRRRFFTPLGLSQTYFQGDEELPGDGAHGYLLKSSGFAGLSDGTDYRPNTSAATVAWSVGNVLASAHDIATWTRALYGGQVLRPASLAKMVKFNESRYGFGTRLFDVGGSAGWGHTGSLRGYTAVTWHVPDHGLTVTVLTNRGRIRPESIALELSQAAIAAQATPVAARPLAA